MQTELRLGLIFIQNFSFFSFLLVVVRFHVVEYRILLPFISSFSLFTVSLSIVCLYFFFEAMKL